MEECQSQITVIDNQIEPLKSVDAILTSKKESLETKQAGYIAFQNNLKVMQKLPRIQQDLTDTQILCNDLTDKIKKCASELQKLKEQFNSQRFQDLEKQKSELTNQLGLLQGKITQNSQQLKKLQAKLTEIQEKEADLQTTKSTRDELMQIDKFSQSIREIYHQAGPKITEALLNNINRNASEIYRELMDQPDVQLIWKQDYDVELRSATILVENARTFKQLSGGEQMAVALAIRLALLKTLSNLNIAFLDEPTTNLDVEKRRNLAQCVKRIKGFKQLFVISHDDTFNDMAQNVIRFVKTENDVTKVVQQ
jgi:exonuclease SbcC